MPADRCGETSGSSAGLCRLCFQGELGAEPGCQAVWEEVYVRLQRGDVLELGPGNQGSSANGSEVSPARGCYTWQHFKRMRSNVRQFDFRPVCLESQVAKCFVESPMYIPQKIKQLKSDLKFAIIPGVRNKMLRNQDCRQPTIPRIYHMMIIRGD